MILKQIAALTFLLLGCGAGLSSSAIAQDVRPTYSMFVSVPDVESKFINGEFRFCERENLRGIVCGREGKIFGKRQFIVQDWWSPETYVQAYTQRMDAVVIGIQPTGDSRGVTITYSVP